MGKLLISVGLTLVLIGAAITWAPWLVNWFGRLPGDIRIERESGTFYLPITSMLLLSVVLSVFLSLLRR
ncbi:MAG: DUF2905 domain-containing protein [Gammaproteobacteria bacterium]|nr:MAG: DUF2905 domain-containing protein [Gammaproteobacteria bacterium]